MSRNPLNIFANKFGYGKSFDGASEENTISVTPPLSARTLSSNTMADRSPMTSSSEVFSFISSRQSSNVSAIGSTPPILNNTTKETLCIPLQSCEIIDYCSSINDDEATDITNELENEKNILKRYPENKEEVWMDEETSDTTNR
eukprot:UN01137